MTNIELINKAKEALINSYSPYSNFKVGAAILTKNGKVYTGCNIENISYSATICAERVALFNAISNGEKEFTKIAIVSKSDKKEFKDFAEDLTFPCGVCRQVLVEFMKNGEIILQNKAEDIQVFKVSELLPYSFSV